MTTSIAFIVIFFTIYLEIGIHILECIRDLEAVFKVDRKSSAVSDLLVIIITPLTLPLTIWRDF